MANKPVRCKCCGIAAKLVTGAVIYPHRRDLAQYLFWLCEKCGAYVGCHAGTDRPKGSLANAELRKARVEAHRSFDALWQSGEMSRHQAYRWLQDVLDVPERRCHIAMFDLRNCCRVMLAVETKKGLIVARREHVALAAQEGK